MISMNLAVRASTEHGAANGPKDPDDCMMRHDEDCMLHAAKQSNGIPRD